MTGPLKDIDKGSFNIGKAWAEGFQRGLRIDLGSVLCFLCGRPTGCVKFVVSIDGEKRIICAVCEVW